MTKPGCGVRFVCSYDLRWQGAKSNGGGVMAVFLSHIAGLCYALITSKKGHPMSTTKNETRDLEAIRQSIEISLRVLFPGRSRHEATIGLAAEGLIDVKHVQRLIITFDRYSTEFHHGRGAHYQLICAESSDRLLQSLVAKPPKSVVTEPKKPKRKSLVRRGTYTKRPTEAQHISLVQLRTLDSELTSTFVDDEQASELKPLSDPWKIVVGDDELTMDANGVYCM